MAALLLSRSAPFVFDMQAKELDSLGDVGDLSACDLHASLTNERLWQGCWRYGFSALLESWWDYSGPAGNEVRAQDQPAARNDL